MNATEAILAGIEATRAAVLQAALDWHPADLARVHSTLLALEGAVPRLRDSLAAIPGAGKLPVQQLRTAAQSLRDEAAKLEFMVDTAAAFVRRSPALASLPQIYNAGGALPLDNPIAGESYSG